MTEATARVGRVGHLGRVGRLRIVIAVIAVIFLAAKLVIADRTLGTNDVSSWIEFARGESLVGPIRIYSFVWEHDLYNHPPLIGYFLQLVNLAQSWGSPPRFTIRLAASVADVAATFVVFELLRRRRPLNVAAASAVMVAASPVLFVVSGFHGNTDPIFTMLTVTSLWLLADRRMPVLAGIAIGLAIGVKVIPMVAIPALGVYAWKRGRREAISFGAAFTAVFLLTWGPALVLEFGPILEHVVGYPGTGITRWGIVQLGHWTGTPWWARLWNSAVGRSLEVLICALVPGFAVWRRPGAVVPAVAWSLIAFLALASSFGVQYFVWPVAAAYLIGFCWSTAYNLTAGGTLIEIYNRWSGGLPWNYAIARPFTIAETYYFLVPWILLLVVLVQATGAIFPGRRDAWLRSTRTRRR